MSNDYLNYPYGQTGGRHETPANGFLIAPAKRRGFLSGCSSRTEELHMLVLTIRTDKPEAEIGLYDGETQLAYETWQAHRQLAETIHQKIESLLISKGLALQHIGGLACFQGPGSFTGLRIGLSVANAMAYSYKLPIVATQNPAWLETGLGRLQNGETDTMAVPHYGADVYITPPKK